MWSLSHQQAIPSALGVSVIRDLDVNSLAVPRKAKEAIGGITQLTHKNGQFTSNFSSSFVVLNFLTMVS